MDRMKAVVKSVSTEIFENIIDKKCSVLNSKTTPNCETPFKVYVYCNKAKNQWRFSDYEGSYKNSDGEFVCAQQRVAAEFVCDSTANGWHISDLKIYDTPKKLSEFYYCCKEMKANEPRAGKYVSLSCYACRHNALKRTEDYSEYNNMLGYICKRNITRPPSNWCYVEDLGEAK